MTVRAPLAGFFNSLRHSSLHANYQVRVASPAFSCCSSALRRISSRQERQQRYIQARSLSTSPSFGLQSTPNRFRRSSFSSSDLSTQDLKPNNRARRNAPTRDSEGLEEEEASDPASREGTDISALNVLADVAAPTTAIDACLDDGFHLDNGVKITNGDGCLLVDGEVFRWRPWIAADGKKSQGQSPVGAGIGMINEKGQWEVTDEVWGILKLVWPKPDLLILGLGASNLPLSPETRRQINLLGIRIEVLDTRNAAAQFNLLATERGVREVAAALIPIGWRANKKHAAL